MNVAVMRRLDRWLGVPLCWFAGLIFGRKKSAQPPIIARSVLVIKFFGMGSVLLTAPFLKRLRHAYPAARIHVLTFSSNTEILKRLAAGLECHYIRTSSIVSFVRDTITALSLLRKEGVDVVFDLEFFSKYSTLLSTLTRAPVRVGYALPTFWRSANVTHPTPLDRSTHVAGVFLRQLEAIGISTPSGYAMPVLQPTPAEDASMHRKLGLGTNGAECIAVNINAGATSLERRWPAERFLELVACMHEENPSRRFFFTGSSDERSYVQAALASRAEFADFALNCAGLLTLGEFIALLRRCTLFITNDSGPMHIAAAVGTPLVALFGPETPHFYGPLADARVVYKQLSCSPCLNVYNAKLFVCPFGARCMQELSVIEVLSAVRLAAAPPQRVGAACS